MINYQPTKRRLISAKGISTNVNELVFGKFTFAIASVSSLSLILLGLFLVPNFSPSPTHAEGAASDPTISIVPASNLTVDINPGASGTFNSGSANVTVNTTNATGYTFTMSTETTDTDLRNNRIDYTQSGNTNLKITNLSSSTAQSNFTNNKWGYNVAKSGTYIKGAANTYIPVPNSNSQQSDKEIEVTNTTGSNTYTFNYGVKADLSLPSGDYSNTIVYSATANPLPTMQDFDYDTCQSLTTEQAITLYDERDNKSYKVAKLADDNCWMLDNLALDLVASKNNITSSNTNASDTYLNYLKGNSTGTTSDQYPTAGVSYWGSVNSYSAPLIAIKNANDDTWNPDTVASTTYGNGSGRVGIYYNYCAASAGSYCWGNGSSSTGSPSSDPKSGTLYDIDADICPAGWHMPTTTSGGEYYYLYNTAYAANATNFKTALSTPLSGFFNSGSAYGQGSYGFFWSSTWYSTSGMSYLYVNASNVSPSGSNYRSTGYSLRCVKDPPPKIENGMYMQDVTEEHISNTPAEVTYTLKDKRDEKSYAVAKLADGNLWMQDNLALDLVTSKNNITSSNTNASDTYLNYLKGNSTGTTSDKYPTAGVAYWTSSYSYSAPLIVINGNCQDNSECVNNPSSGQWTSDAVAPVTYGNGSGKIGIYYNFCAASAGSYCWGNGTSDTGSPSSDPKPDTLYDIDADICPAGWHMPTTTSGGEYYNLYNTAYSANQANFKNALSTPLSGFFYYGSTYYQGSSGFFWSSTRSNTTYDMKSLYISASIVGPSSDYDRAHSFSLRCVRSGA